MIVIYQIILRIIIKKSCFFHWLKVHIIVLNFPIVLSYHEICPRTTIIINYSYRIFHYLKNPFSMNQNFFSLRRWHQKSMPKPHRISKPVLIWKFKIRNKPVIFIKGFLYFFINSILFCYIVNSFHSVYSIFRMILY